jgi:GAF domain-containing protein
MTNPFDDALAESELREAATEYASRYGEAGAAAYLKEWFEFRQLIRTCEDLRRWRAARAKLGSNEATEAAFDSAFELPVLAAASRDVSSILDAAVRRAMSIDHTGMANAQLFDPQVGGLCLTAHSGFTSDFLEFFHVVDGTQSACGSAFRTHRPVWVSDATQSPIFAGTSALEVLTDTGLRAVASLPVISPSGRLIGVISTHHTRPTAWTDERKLNLERLARSIGRLLHELVSP